MDRMLEEILQQAMKEQAISLSEACFLFENAPLESLTKAACFVRDKHTGKRMDLCTIMNVKSGKCSEDCRFCAQSGHFNTGTEVYDPVDIDAVRDLAQNNEASGVHRFSLVASGKAVKGNEFEDILETLKQLKPHTTMKLCVSLGCIDYSQAKALKEVGVVRYHHNIETCRAFYPEICTTHTWDERTETIAAVQRAGIEVCCGGIIGLGESIEQRLRMAFEIKGLGVASVPINILNPIAGTPMEKMKVLAPEDILRTVALFRLILPKTELRIAGGRSALGHRQAELLNSGINGLMVGNYLTTMGCGMEEDMERIKAQGFEVQNV